MEYNVCNIEGKEFIEVDSITIDSTTYLFLSNKENINDFCIRKVIYVDNEEYLDGLETEEEFNKAMAEFANKNKEEITNL